MSKPKPVKHHPDPILSHNFKIIAEVIAAAIFLKKLLKATVPAARFARSSVRYVIVVLLHQARPRELKAEKLSTTARW